MFIFRIGDVKKAGSVPLAQFDGFDALIPISVIN